MLLFALHREQCWLLPRHTVLLETGAFCGGMVYATAELTDLTASTTAVDLQPIQGNSISNGTYHSFSACFSFSRICIEFVNYGLFIHICQFLCMFLAHVHLYQYVSISLILVEQIFLSFASTRSNQASQTILPSKLIECWTHTHLCQITSPALLCCDSFATVVPQPYHRSEKKHPEPM